MESRLLTLGKIGFFLIIGLAGCSSTDSVTKPSAAENQPAGSASQSADAIPWFLENMVKIIQEKNEVIRDNLPDCTKTLQRLIDHLEKNLSRFLAIGTAFQQFELSATDEQKNQMAQQIMRQLGPIFNETVKVQTEFLKTCPQEAKRIDTVMKTMEMKVKSNDQKTRL